MRRWQLFLVIIVPFLIGRYYFARCPFTPFEHVGANALVVLVTLYLACYVQVDPARSKVLHFCLPVAVAALLATMAGTYLIGHFWLNTIVIVSALLPILYVFSRVVPQRQ